MTIWLSFCFTTIYYHKKKNSLLLKLPMTAMPTESWLCPLVCAPTMPHPRPSYSIPFCPTKKLKKQVLLLCGLHQLLVMQHMTLQ